MHSRRNRRVGLACGTGALALVLTPLCMAAGVADSPTTHETNKPEQCTAFDSNGNVVALQPGDCAQYGVEGQGRTDAHAKNVILIIGDGMGQQEITAARNYLVGAAGRFEGIDELTSEGLYTHHSVNKDGSFNYVTDSAASGTAWATGTKTYNNAISVDIKGQPVANLIEVAKNKGMRTGNITTSEIQDATPAVMGAHVASRSCYAPSGKKKANCPEDQRVNGGLGSISEQLIDTRADITLGGGASFFDTEVMADSGNTNPFLTGSAKYNTTWTKGASVLDNAKNNGYQVVTTADELNAISTANQDTPVLGLFAPSNMTTTFAPSQATIGGAKGEAIQCTKQDIGTEPELVDMTSKAIELLNQDNDKGFFLQIESASIDKRDHASDACGQIGETKRLDEATKVALDFAKQDGETLVLVTADHSHTSQIVADGSDNVSPVTRLLTADNSTMSITYGTNASGSQQHTGAQLRVAAFGPGEENVLGQTDQTDLFFTIANALNMNPYPDRAGNGSSARTAVPTGTLPKPVPAQDAFTTCRIVEKDGSVHVPAAGECSQYGAAGPQRSGSEGEAKNVILFIGDGMGDSEITSARNYLYGANGRLPGVDNLDYTGSYTHFALNKDGSINYVTDSAASATGWSTGTKTYNGAIGVDLQGNAVSNLMERAKAAGYKTGNVTTSEIQDATPAGAAVHSLNRKCYGPEYDKNSSSCQGDEYLKQFRENGGLGSISEQLVDMRADVTLGGGAKAFDQTVQVDGTWGDTTKWTAGKSVVDNARDNGFQVVTTADELAAVTNANQDAPVLGLFSPGNMPRMFNETVPTTDGASLPAQSCEFNPERTAEIPTLAAMTKKAINLLQNDKGFFLQVEAASIDKADHAADACGQIGELDDLDQAIQVAQNWVATSGQPTLIVVTADHAHTSQITSGGTETFGRTTKLRTADGSDMVINYANAGSNDDDVALGGQGHTGAQLRVAASGPGAENVVGRTDQSDLYYTMINALGFDSAPLAVDNQFVATSETPDQGKGKGTDPAGGKGQVKPDTTGKGQGTDAGDKKYAASRPGMARTGSTAVPLTAAAAVLVTLGAGAGLYTRRRSH